jgi:pseudo-rSAM protein
LFLSGIIEQLQDIDNGYCVEIAEHELNLYEMIEFVELLRKNFCGDAIDQEMTNMKPFSLYPVPYVMKNRKKLQSDSDLSIGEKIMDYLHVLTIQITGVCDLKCVSCSNSYLQTISCNSFGEKLEYETVEDVFKQISGCNLSSINIIGGDVFGYQDWEKLIFLLHQYPYRYNWYTDYRHLLGNDQKLQEIKSLDLKLQVIISGMFDQNILVQILKLISHMSFELIFHISSEEQILAASSFCENHQLENYALQPIYSESNPDFFRNFIFMDEDSIVASPISKQSIFANMTVNAIDFGKLTIFSNGDVYANTNFSKFGNIKTDTIREMICLELEQGESWFRIRNKKPCSECIYQWLCPPPSNYEIVIGKSNLCHVAE